MSFFGLGDILPTSMPMLKTIYRWFPGITLLQGLGVNFFTAPSTTITLSNLTGAPSVVPPFTSAARTTTLFLVLALSGTNGSADSAEFVIQNPTLTKTYLDSILAAPSIGGKEAMQISAPVTVDENVLNLSITPSQFNPGVVTVYIFLNAWQH